MGIHTKILLLTAITWLLIVPVYAADLGQPTNAAPPTAYFPLLPMGEADAQPQLMPVASNYPLEDQHPGMIRAIIVIHDLTRNANATLGMMTSLAGEAGNSTFIMAPQFLQDSDIAHFASNLPEQGKLFARWPLDAWMFGDDSITPQQKGISSFTAIDLLLMYLADKKYFPDLKTVVIAGHGAGGDFVQRYAALGQGPDILDQQHIDVRFIAANASSYLYFTSSRPKGEQGFAPADATQCNAFNSYPYGLDNLNAYGKRVGTNTIKLRYVTRNVNYLIGEQAAQGDKMPDNSCAGLDEGADRISRAVYYNFYLKVIFGDTATRLQHFMTLPKTAYEPAAMFGSACGTALLFGNGECR